MRDIVRALFFLSAVGSLLIGSVVFYSGAAREEEKRERYAASNALVLAFRETEHEALTPVFSISEEDFYQTGDIAKESGAAIKEIKILPSEAQEHGEILKMKLIGEGTFAQVTAIFDIINTNKQWISAELRRLERKGGALSFEIELAAYRSRGHL